MKIWVLCSRDSNEANINLYASWSAGYKEWKEQRDSTAENFSEEDLDNEDFWNEDFKDGEYANCACDGDYGWWHLDLYSVDVKGLEGRNKV